MLYLCGHPGQGKTAVLNQTLSESFGDREGHIGGIDERLYILKYNAYRYEKPASFAAQLVTDLSKLVTSKVKSSHIMDS